MLNLAPIPDGHQHGGWKPTQTPVTVYFSYAWLAISHCPNSVYDSLQCRRILGGRNLVCVRNIVVAAIFDFMTVEDWGE